ELAMAQRLSARAGETARTSHSPMLSPGELQNERAEDLCPETHPEVEVQPSQGTQHPAGSSLSAPPVGPAAPQGVQDDTDIPDLRRLPFADWLASLDPSGSLLCYLSVLEECYDTVAQIAQTYTVVDKDARKRLDPLLFADLGIAEMHRNLFTDWFVRFCGVESALALHPRLLGWTADCGSAEDGAGDIM
ncbi:unnamed protein product, partial [Durusdinium trenchii]